MIKIWKKIIFIQTWFKTMYTMLYWLYKKYFFDFKILHFITIKNIYFFLIKEISNCLIFSIISLNQRNFKIFVFHKMNLNINPTLDKSTFIYLSVINKHLWE